MISRSARHIAGHISCTLGIIWASAGALKEIFGTHVTAPFIPHLDLERVHEGQALFVGVCLYVLGAWLLRSTDSTANQQGIDDDAAMTRSQLESGSRADGLPMPPSHRDDRVSVRDGEGRRPR